jgi:hypothetical protein
MPNKQPGPPKWYAANAFTKNATEAIFQKKYIDSLKRHIDDS